ncbi:hypothetical protein EMIT047CA2_330011 [Pseudomonas soli]
MVVKKFCVLVRLVGRTCESL